MYNNIYDSDYIRNNDYCVTDYILEYYKENYICLDLGCGSCRKIPPLASKVNYYYAIDNDKQRILDASLRCSKNNNIILGVGDNFYLPFEDEFFDLVSCFMTKYSISETSRVLKKRWFIYYRNCRSKR